MYQYSKPMNNPMDILRHSPWTIAVSPFRLTAKTWYISGQSWVGAYLIDTGEGCILIDAGVPESLYLLVASVFKAGYRLDDIKKILISHAHFDHLGAAMAVKKLTGAELLMSNEDFDFMSRYPDEVFFPGEGSEIQTVVPDSFFSGVPVKQGTIEIKTILTPGHTPGCTSFFWKEKDRSGNPLTVGLHGGVGLNTMSDEYYSTSKAMTPELRRRYIRDMKELRKMHVDVTLPSHPNQIEIIDRAGQWSEDCNVYCDSEVWPAFIARHLNQAVELEGQQKEAGLLGANK